MSTLSQRKETCRRTSHNRFGNSFKVSAKATDPSRHVALTKGVVGPYRSGLVRSPPVPQYGESFPHPVLDGLENLRSFNSANTTLTKPEVCVTVSAS